MVAVILSPVTSYFIDEAYGGIKNVTVEDKGKYSRVVIYLDKQRHYELVKDGSRDILIEFGESLKAMKNAAYKSGLVKSIKQTDGWHQRRVITVSLHRLF